MLKRFTAALAASVSVLTSYPAVPGGASEGGNNTFLKVMPVGDSITDGYWEQGGYRKYMWCALAEDGYTGIDLVGPKGSNSETFEYKGKQVYYDGNYAGYSGYAIQQMNGTEARQGILETLQNGDYIRKFSPDIVLLQIGTNDILSAYNDGITDRLENLITYILDEGCRTVYVTTIPDIDVSLVSDWLWAYGEVKWNSTPEAFAEIVQGHIDSYNASIKALAAKMQGEGRDVRFADIHSVVDMKADLYDGVHPNEQGYEKMGRYWAGVLEAHINGTELPTGETDTSKGQLEVQYDVADLVSLAGHLLGRPQERITAENYKAYDLNGNSKLDVYDLVLLRRKLFSGGYV